MGRPTMFMMVGLVASGKSTFAKTLAEIWDANIWSSDTLREQMYGDINDQTHNTEVFNELHRGIKEDLCNGKSVIYDATNLSRKRRRAFLQELTNIPCQKIAYLIATPYEECLRRNALRERKVPERVINRMYKSFEMPSTLEGFDEVFVNWEDAFTNYYGDATDFFKMYKAYNQNNPHHTLTLGEHCMAAYNYICDKHPQDIELQVATLLHDCGKPNCKSFQNHKGEMTDVAHYYSHEHCGAYNSLFFDFIGIDKRTVALMIEYHMRPYMAWRQSTKAMQKDKNFLGQNLFDKILRLHEADLNAH